MTEPEFVELQKKVKQLEDWMDQTIFPHMRAVNVLLAEKYPDEIGWEGVISWYSIKQYRERKAQQLAQTITDLQDLGYTVIKNQDD